MAEQHNGEGRPPAHQERNIDGDKRQRWGLSTRMIVTINGSIGAILALLIFLQVRQASSYARAQAAVNIEDIAQRYSSQIAEPVNDAMLAARTVSQTFEGLKIAFVDDRSLYSSVLRRVLAANTNFLSTWTCWEPDAFDGKDKDFKDKSGSDGTGRFIPLLWRDKTEIKLDNLSDYSRPGAGDYYLLPKTSGKDTLQDPQIRKVGANSVYVTTAAVPIHDGDAVAGAVGIDIEMAGIQNIVESIHPYGAGFARILTAKGVTVAHSDKAKVGAVEAGGEESRTLLADVLSGRSRTRVTAINSSEFFEIFVPIRTGDLFTSWVLVVSLPMDRVMAEASSLMRRSIGFSVVALFLMVIIVTGLARSVARPLHRLGGKLMQVVELLGQTSQQLTASSKSVAEGAGTQAASLEETSASLEEMSGTIKRNAESAKGAKELAAQACAAAETGTQNVQAMSQSMNRIHASSDEMRKAMDAVKESNNEVSKIIKTIDEIAFQTNILALNAAVEAARAGEAGLGFAVVADEVRNLAQKSAAAARETADKIEKAITRTEAGVRVSEKVVVDLSTLLDQSTKVETSLKGIEQKSREVDSLVAEIAAASSEQSQGIEQVNLAVSQMDKVTQTNAAIAEQSSGASSEVSLQAVNLKKAVLELLQLVNGRQQTLSGESQPSVAGDNNTAGASPGRPKSSAGGGVRKSSAASGAVSRGGELPLTGDFKDF